MGVVLAAILCAGILPMGAAKAETPNEPPAWLEPRGLSVVDLVGLVPESQLQDSILVFTGGAGILQYQSGSRNGNQVIVRTRVTPRYVNPLLPQTTLNCLGKRALFDEWPVPVPASLARIYAGGVDVTHQVIAVWYYQTGPFLPTRNASDGAGRYKEFEVQGPATFAQDGALHVPANMGCTIFLAGSYTDLEAQFEFQVANQLAVTSLGSETFSFGAYVGIGTAGVLDPLQEQMRDRFVERHDKFILNPPRDAEFVWVKFPPTPVSPYSGSDPANIQLPSSGTYRLANGPKDLSVDHTVSMGLPFRNQWLDADLKHENLPTDGQYLPLLARIDTLSSPEYFVPTGIAYDPCMTQGDCPVTLLDQIFAAQMEMTVYYFAIERTASPFDRVPLRQVGPEWEPGASAGTVEQGVKPVTAVIPSQVFVPLITAAPNDISAGCPCGWFTTDGRMLDFTNAP